MLYQIRGKLVKKEENRVIINVNNFLYEVYVPRTVSRRFQCNKEDIVELVIYHYFSIDKNRGTPILVGFIDELERDFFQKFISVSGVGPKAALKAFDKPISAIARAIEEADITFLTSLAGIGRQRAKQIIAQLQGKVGRFALLPEGEEVLEHLKREIIQEAKEILKRLQYNSKEIENMIKLAIDAKPDLDSSEELLNEIYRQRKQR